MCSHFRFLFLSWQQKFNEDREKGTTCNMILCHCPHSDPDTWEGLRPASLTALPQTLLPTCGQVSIISTSVLRLYRYGMVLGERREIRLPRKGKNQEKIFHIPDFSLKKFITVSLRAKRTLYFFFPPAYYRKVTLYRVTKHGFF